MEAGKILFLDTVHEVLQQRLEAAGYSCVSDYTSSREALLPMLPSVRGIVLRSRIAIDGAFLRAGSRLQFIARSGAGLEHIDLEAAAALNITVYHAAEANRDAVGEHALGMLLMLFNKLHTAHSEVSQGQWRRAANRGIELRGKTVGIIGFGHMGSAFAEKLRGMGCRILSYDKYKPAGYAPAGVEACSLDKLQAESDIVSLHLPLSAETMGYADRSFFERLARPITLINTARGSHVVIPHLLQALEQGRVQGACLDVLPYEHSSFEVLASKESAPEFQALARHPRVVLTPHVAGWTTESYYKLSSVLADKILADYPRGK